MTRQPPPHRRKRDPLRRQVLGAYHPPPLPPGSTHVFAPSGRRDVYRRRICAVCDGIEQARVHRVPEVPDEAGEIDQRRGGE